MYSTYILACVVLMTTGYAAQADKCDNINCHHGRCEEVPNEETGENITCFCEPGYIGRRCERQEESTTVESTTSSSQEPCVLSQECPPELQTLFAEMFGGFSQSQLTLNESRMTSFFHEDFIIRGCDFPAIECKEDLFDVFGTGKDNTVLESTYCEWMNIDIAYWEFYLIAGRTGAVNSASILFKKVDGKWKVFRVFTLPHKF